MYKSTSINPFLYAPQTDQALILAAQKDFDLERNKKSFAISKKDCKQVSSHIKGIGKINTMDNIVMTCANICGIQLAIIDISPGKPLLYQFAWKLVKFIENKNFNQWHACNAQSLVHLLLLFMAKLHQFFMHLAAFSQNSLNTNKVEHGITSGNQGLDIKKMSVAVKLASKFLKKMTEHIKDDTVPKEVPSFARNLFTDSLSRPQLLVKTNVASIIPAATTTTQSKGGKKKDGE
jgi:hypothetical protein